MEENWDASMRPGRLTPENLRREGVDSQSQIASMRPGRLTPENSPVNDPNDERAAASMRPGRLTPENGASAADPVGSPTASMRPGRLTPENLSAGILLACGCRCFNEAGAINPGKPECAVSFDSRRNRLQ